jgi:hypothetical protein
LGGGDFGGGNYWPKTCLNEAMKLTPTETGWLIRSETNKEEFARTHFLKVHEHLSFSTTSTNDSVEAARIDLLVPHLCHAQPVE